MNGLLQNELNRQLLKYAAGYAMTCRRCTAILDCRRAVNIDVKSLQTGNTLRNFTVCGTCYDEARADLELAAAGKTTLEIIDGRLLWPATTPTPKSARKPAAPKIALVPGNTYRIRLTDGRWTDGRLLGERVIPAFNTTWRTGRATTHWRFINLATGRDVEIKSRQRIRALGVPA